MERIPSNGAAWSRIRNAIDRLSAAVAARFAIDPRALAAFRIGLGTLLLADLARRSRWLTAFYTDYGVLPRRAFLSDYSTRHSLHALVGEPWAVALLFAVAGAFALALLVGYRTRLATVVSWLLLLSLQARNPMVLNAGDSLLRMLLFWSVFLPLGARWSVDAVRRADARTGAEPDAESTPAGGVDSPALGPSGPAVATVATMAVLLQMLLMYVTNAIHKLGGDLWMSGQAVVYVMQADHFTYLLGNHIAEFHGLLRVLTVLWVALLFASPLLILLTGFPRAVLASLFIGMHLGMAVTMRIDLFPIVVVVGFFPFFQTPVWDAAERALARLGWSTPLSRWRDRLESRARALPSLPRRASLPRPAASGRLGGLRNVDFSAGLTGGRLLFSTVLPYVFLVLIVLSGAQAVDYAEVPEPGEDVLDAVEMDQSWRMFAPDPTYTTRWFVAPGALEDGTERDVLHDSAVSFERPARAETTYPTSRWRKYLGNVYSAGNKNHRSYLANYLCDDWNRTHETGVETVTVYQLYERTHPYNGTVEAEGRVELIEYDCSGEFIQNE